MGQFSRWFVMSCASFALLGCAPEGPFDCGAKCVELETDIRAQVTNPGDDPCGREAIVTAGDDCEECQAAFENEFGLVPDPSLCAL
ncbi:MAG: hypothetical protein ACO3JL_22010 [Myxococcota bacterium]